MLVSAISLQTLAVACVFASSTLAHSSQRQTTAQVLLEDTETSIFERFVASHIHRDNIGSVASTAHTSHLDTLLKNARDLVHSGKRAPKERSVRMALKAEALALLEPATARRAIESPASVRERKYGSQAKSHLSRNIVLSKPEKITSAPAYLAKRSFDDDPDEGADGGTVEDGWGWSTGGDEDLEDENEGDEVFQALTAEEAAVVASMARRMETRPIEAGGDLGSAWDAGEPGECVVSFDQAGVCILTVGGRRMPPPMAPNQKSNVPKTLMAYRQNPFPTATPLFPEPTAIKSYISSNFKHLVPHIIFNHRVTSLRWCTSADGRGSKAPREWIASATPTGSSGGPVLTEQYDFVIIANGHCETPYVPLIPGLSGWKGQISHSRWYRSPEAYEDETVLVVGCSASAQEIAREIAKSISARRTSSRTPNQLPKLHYSQKERYNHDLPFDGGRSEEWTKEITVHPSIYRVQEGTVWFSDGSKLIDVKHMYAPACLSFIFATGYLYSFDFASRTRAPFSNHPLTVSPFPSPSPSSPPTSPGGMRVHNLCQRQLFYLPSPTLALLAVPLLHTPFAVAEAQAHLLATFYGDPYQLPKRLNFDVGIPETAPETREVHYWGLQKEFDEQDRLLLEAGDGETFGAGKWKRMERVATDLTYHTVSPNSRIHLSHAFKHRGRGPSLALAATRTAKWTSQASLERFQPSSKALLRRTPPSTRTQTCGSAGNPLVRPQRQQVSNERPVKDLASGLEATAPLAYLTLDKDPFGAPPTIFNLEPPNSLSLDLKRCDAFCSGETPSDEPFEDSKLNFEQELATAFGGPLPYANLYPAVSGIYLHSAQGNEANLGKQNQDLPYTLSNTEQFSLPLMLSMRVNRQKSLNPQTTHPTLDSADFVLLSLDTAIFARCVSSCSHPDRLPEALSRGDISRKAVAWILEVVAQHGRRRDYPSLILALGRIDHDYERNLLVSRVQKAVKDFLVVVGIEREPWDAADELEWVAQMPYPSIFSLPLSKTRGKAGRKTRKLVGDYLLAQERPYLVTFAGPWGGYELRRHLTSTLASYANDTTIHMTISNPSTQRAPFISSIHDKMLHSVFCLQPPGDSPTRKGFWESISLGCIPVVFRRGTYDKVWTGVLGEIEWDNLALYIDEQGLLQEKGDVVEVLRGVEDEEVKRRQREIAEIAVRVQYGIPEAGVKVGWGGDAFGMLLRQLRAISDVGGEEGA
ncbi:hypothetical protein P7C70_g5184, partial [Phenoliferia sp. Uapishka_3]